MDTCFRCGNELTERRIMLHRKINGKWYMVEDVPALTCENCGEQYFDGPLMLKIDRMLRKGASIDREITVPVVKFVA